MIDNVTPRMLKLGSQFLSFGPFCPAVYSLGLVLSVCNSF